MVNNHHFLASGGGLFKILGEGPQKGSPFGGNLSTQESKKRLDNQMHTYLTYIYNYVHTPTHIYAEIHTRLIPIYTHKYTHT